LSLPRNYSIDIIRYAFELKLSDATDEITGKATTRILCKTNDIRQIRLDLINKTTERLGKGMMVESVMYNNVKVDFKHKQDACSQKPVMILADPRTVLLADIDFR